MSENWVDDTTLRLEYRVDLFNRFDYATPSLGEFKNYMVSIFDRDNASMR